MYLQLIIGKALQLEIHVFLKLKNTTAPVKGLPRIIFKLQFINCTWATEVSFSHWPRDNYRSVKNMKVISQTTAKSSQVSISTVWTCNQDPTFPKFVRIKRPVCTRENLHCTSLLLLWTKHKKETWYDTKGNIIWYVLLKHSLK